MESLPRGRLRPKPSQLAQNTGCGGRRHLFADMSTATSERIGIGKILTAEQADLNKASLLRIFMDCCGLEAVL